MKVIKIKPMLLNILIKVLISSAQGVFPSVETQFYDAVDPFPFVTVNREAHVREVPHASASD